jgi:RNA recognition motif-containing protein
MDIYISGLVPEIGEASLMKLFSAVGKVDSLRLVRDRLTGAPTGYAVIDMTSMDGAERAIQVFNGKSVLGSPIIVSKSRPKSKSKSHR